MHSTDNLDDGYLGSGKHLWNSIHKHGKKNHKKEIMEFLPNRSSLKEREKTLVNEELIHDKLCMNLHLGGDGGFSEEERKKGTQQMLKIIWTDINFRKRNCERNQILFKKLWQNLEYRNKMSYKNSLAFKGNQHTEEFKLKLGLINSIKQKGNGNSQYGTCWITNNKENKKIKKEEIQDYLNQGWSKGRKMVL